MLFPKVQIGMSQSNGPTFLEVKLQCLLMPVIHGGRFLAEGNEFIPAVLVALLRNAGLCLFLRQQQQQPR